MSAAASAFTFRPRTFVEGPRLLGAQAAARGLLGAWATFSSSPSLGCVAQLDEDYEQFKQIIARAGLGARPTAFLPLGDPRSWAGFETVLRPSPFLSDLAWMRRFAEQRTFSICGVTHTLSGMTPALAVAELVTAPIQPWDALVCTSSAARTVVTDMLESQADYLEARIGARPGVRPQLPVIPLGIRCADHAPADQAARRTRLRQRLQIADGDVAILYHGRLSFYQKAHPLPMYLAIERAARQSHARVHLIESGWTEDADAEQELDEAASLFDRFRRVRVRRQDAALQDDVWYGADLFVSLSDNVQETFGLTPIEAMASGLPVVVSDWDGYRETVRDGVDGFRVPTLVPPPGAGEVLAGLLPVEEGRNDHQVAGYAALCTAVDVDACARALARLIADPALRREMGEAGRRRARELFDWSAIIPRYDELFAELAALRSRAPESARPTGACRRAPVAEDPFRRFGAFASRALAAADVVALGASAHLGLHERLASLAIVRWGEEARLDDEQVAALVAHVREAGLITVAELERRLGGPDPATLQRTVVHLVKLDVLGVTTEVSPQG